MDNQNGMNEQWEYIKGYEGYYMISNYGRVMSLNRPGSGCFNENTIMHINDNGKGYKLVCLTVNKVRKNKYIHRLMAEHFIDNPDNKPLVNHIDGNKSNNTISNLEWCTLSENMQHASRTGLLADGERCHFSKLTAKDVIEIRHLNKIKVKRNIIIRNYNISPAQYHRIVNKELWKNT